MKKIVKTVCLILVLLLFMVMAVGCGDSDTDAKQVGTVDANSTQEDVVLKDKYYVGDELDANGMSMVYVSSKEYKSDNQFIQPESGNKYICLEFYAKNDSDSDMSISEFDFECYADGYVAEQLYLEEDTLSASLSKGRFTTGKVYFEVPKDASDIEVEYEINWFSDQKITFVFEGDKDSGFTPELTTTASEDAYKAGAIVEVSDLRITYLGCSEYKSANQFVQPNSGNKFISLEFEFENIGQSDEFISSMSFTCYADGRSCDSTYIRDDDLSATISSGKKAKGTVSFEIPKDSNLVEVEYEPNVFSSKKVVFSVE